MRCGARSRFENISFSNLIMKNVTGPITVGLDSARRNSTSNPSTPPANKGIVRNISFNGIRGFVVGEGRQHPDLPWPQKFRPGETRHCIVINGVGDDVIENVSFQDIHFTFEGGGTALEAAAEVPRIAGEYFEIGTPPAYALYARNVRGLTINNVRFDVSKPDFRPAVDLDNVSDVTINGMSAQGNTNAKSVVRVKDARDVLMTASRVLTPASAFIELVGPNNTGVTVEGGDLSKAAKPMLLNGGAISKSIQIRV
jgi:hypothetical protein